MLSRISKQERVYHAIMDDIENVYFSSQSGVFKVGKDKCGQIRFENESDVQDLETKVIAESSDNRILLGTTKGLYFVDNYDARLTIEQFRDMEITAIATKEDGSGGKFWVGTRSKGLFRVDAAGPAPLCLESRELPGTGCSDHIRALHWDAKDRLWVGVNSNIYIVASSTRKIVSVEPIFVSRFYETREAIWARTIKDGSKFAFTGGYRLEESGPPVPIFSSELEIQTNTANEIGGETWFGTSRGVFRYVGKFPQHVEGIYESVNTLAQFKDRIWIGSSRRLFYGYRDSVESSSVRRLNVQAAPREEIFGNELDIIDFVSIDKEEGGYPVFFWGRTGLYRFIEDVEIDLIHSRSLLSAFFQGSRLLEVSARYSHEPDVPQCPGVESPVFRIFATTDVGEFSRWRSEDKFSPAPKVVELPAWRRSAVHVVAWDSNTNIFKTEDSQEAKIPVQKEIDGADPEEFLAWNFSFPFWLLFGILSFLVWLFIASIVVWLAPYSKRARFALRVRGVAGVLSLWNTMIYTIQWIARHLLLGYIESVKGCKGGDLTSAVLQLIDEQRIGQQYRGLLLVLMNEQESRSRRARKGKEGESRRPSSAGSLLKQLAGRQLHCKNKSIKRRIRRAIPLILDVSAATREGAQISFEMMAQEILAQSTNLQKEIVDALLQRATFIFMIHGAESVSAEEADEFIGRIWMNNYVVVVSTKNLPWLKRFKAVELRLHEGNYLMGDIYDIGRDGG